MGGQHASRKEDSFQVWVCDIERLVNDHNPSQGRDRNKAAKPRYEYIHATFLFVWNEMDILHIYRIRVACPVHGKCKEKMGLVCVESVSVSFYFHLIFDCAVLTFPIVEY